MAKGTLEAYCIKLKAKAPFKGKPVIEKTSRGGYMAKGETKEGHKMCKIMSETDANQAIKDGIATKGF